MGQHKKVSFGWLFLFLDGSPPSFYYGGQGIHMGQ
jgi:hypothetical protein